MKLIIFAPKRGRIIEIQLNSARIYCELQFEWLSFKQFAPKSPENNAILSLGTIKNPIKLAKAREMSTIAGLFHNYKHHLLGS